MQSQAHSNSYHLEAIRWEREKVSLAEFSRPLKLIFSSYFVIRDCCFCGVVLLGLEHAGFLRVGKRTHLEKGQSPSHSGVIPTALVSLNTKSFNAITIISLILLDRVSILILQPLSIPAQITPQRRRMRRPIR